MTKKRTDAALKEPTSPNKIADIAAHYLSLVGGASGTFAEFLQFTQNAGEPGGPATDGGAFWQQVMRYRRLEINEN